MTTKKHEVPDYSESYCALLQETKKLHQQLLTHNWDAAIEFADLIILSARTIKMHCLVEKE